MLKRAYLLACCAWMLLVAWLSTQNGREPTTSNYVIAFGPFWLPSLARHALGFIFYGREYLGLRVVPRPGRRPTRDRPSGS
jgi:hypothetical protein